jgi:hypothetical protein
VARALTAFSLVIPTRNEAANAEGLIAAICAAMPGSSKELVFVNDSDDATPALHDDHVVVLGHDAPEQIAARHIAAGDPSEVQETGRPSPCPQVPSSTWSRCRSLHFHGDTIERSSRLRVVRRAAVSDERDCQHRSRCVRRVATMGRTDSFSYVPFRIGRRGGRRCNPRPSARCVIPAVSTRATRMTDPRTRNCGCRSPTEKDTTAPP